MNRPLLNASLGIAAFALLGTSLVNGQTPSRPTSPGTGSPAGNIPANPNPNIPSTGTPGTPGNYPTQPGQMPPTMDNTRRPIFLSGKVMLDDGTPPPDSARIVRVCGSGRIIPEAVTDRKGRFSFQVGQDTAMLADASDEIGMRNAPGYNTQSPMGGMRERDLMSCELRAELAGYRSESVSLAMHRSLDNPDIGTIILHRRTNVEGTTISATTLEAPKDAKKAYEKGHQALNKGKLDDAQKNLQKAVDAYPKFAAAWYDLGVLEDNQKNADAARKAFNESMAADAKFIPPYQGLAMIEARDSKWPQVADLTDKVIHLNPIDYPQAYFLNAVAKLNQQKLDDAEKSANALIAMDTHHQIPRVEHVMGVILAQKQDYNGAAVHMRKFIELSQPSPEVDLAKKQLADLEKSLSANHQ